jgi:hypothetical protein
MNESFSGNIRINRRVLFAVKLNFVVTDLWTIKVKITRQRRTKQLIIIRGLGVARNIVIRFTNESNTHTYVRTRSANFLDIPYSSTAKRGKKKKLMMILDFFPIYFIHPPNLIL